jgi:hypothetical protein
MARKKPGRKKEPAPKRGIAWPRWTGFRGKTFWDWLQLLIVPGALVVISFWFAWWQNNSQQALEARQRAQEARSQAQYSALQAYLDQMSQLMFERDLPGSEEGDAVFTLAQARTTTAIRQLDGEQNQIVTHFLSDSGLLSEPDLLAEAGLPNAELPKAMLQGANLAGTRVCLMNVRIHDSFRS